jgi:hypothetical protein
MVDSPDSTDPGKRLPFDSTVRQGLDVTLTAAGI